MRIHPTAIVDSGALLGDEVEIGAYSVIGPEVVIGTRSVIQSHVVLEGSVQIGERNVVGQGTLIGGPPQDLTFSPDTRSSVVIGDDNILREHCTVHRGSAAGSATTLGDRNFLMAGAHVGHNCQVGSDVIIANNCLLGGYVKIDDRAFLGGGTVLHQHMQVGRLVITQGASGFSMDIPPFLLAAQRNIVVGVNILGLRRAGMSRGDRDEIKRAFKLLYRSGLNTRQAVERAVDSGFGPLGREFFEFVSNAKKRGIAPYRHARAEAKSEGDRH